MKTMTLAKFKKALKAQGVSKIEHCAFICPMCGTIQSGADLISAGAGKTFDEVEKYTAFSCVGRFTDAGPYVKNSGQVGCDWTLGGLLGLHKFEVITDDGKHHPRFELATPKQAQKQESSPVRHLAALAV